MYHRSWKKNIVNKAGFCLLGIMVWASTAIPPVAQANTRNQLNKLKVQLQRHATRISLLGQSLQKINPSGRVSLAKRLSDGQVNFLLKDYLRASILLLDAAENPQYKGRSKWYDAVYILAESLYRNRNLQGAVKYYRVLIQQGQKHSQKALVRLMEISAKTQKSAWLNQYFQRGKQLPPGPLRNKVFYLRAKGLYKLGRSSEAGNIFRQIANTPTYGPRAKYFLAVLALQTPGKPDVKQAMQLLRSALNSIPKDKANRPLREVVLISLGRLRMEIGKHDQALRAFQQISRKSQVFDQALYEICWAYVRRGDKRKKKAKKQREYHHALRTLDLLLAFLPQSPFYPRAQLLKGNLQLQLAPFKTGKSRELLFSQAMTSYQKIAKRYSRVYKEMEQITNRARPIELFKRLVAQQLDQFSVAKILPQDAVRWMSDEELMGRTLIILKDLREMQIQLKSARQIIKLLEGVLRVRNLHSLSPTLRDARLRCNNAKAKLTEFSTQLLSLKEGIVSPQLSSTERQEYQQLRKKLKVIRYLFLQTPKTSKELRHRSSLVMLRINQMTDRLHKISILLSYGTKALHSVRRWLETNAEARKLSPAQRSNLEAESNQFARMITTLKREKSRLQNELELARIRLGYTAAAPQERRTQNKYRLLLEQERLFYNRMKPRLSTDGQSQVSEIQETSKLVRRQQSIVKGYFLKLSRLSDQFAVQVRTKLSTEKVKLDQYEQQIYQLKTSSKALASRIAYNTFLTVRKKFRRLVLQAEVGVIDVAWREKQTIQTQKIRLSKERNSELRVLDSEFRDLVQEVK